MAKFVSLTVDLYGEEKIFSAKKKNALNLGNYEGWTLSTTDGKTITLKKEGKEDITINDASGVKYIFSPAENNYIDIIGASIIDYTTVPEPNKKNVVTGSKFIDTVDYSGYTKGLTINAGKGNDTVRGTNFADKINGGDGDDRLYGNAGNDVIVGGNGYDRIFGGAGNDTITGSKGRTNVYYYIGEGDDVINLTKGENLYIYIYKNGGSITSSDIKYEYTNKNKDLRIYYDKDGVKGSITLKNFASKDGLNNSTKKTADTSHATLYIFGSPVNLKTVLVDSEKGTWRADNIDKSGYTLYTDKKKTIVQTDVTKKGLTIDGKGGNDVITGTNYSDTIKAGTGIDTITGGTGNDKLYGGTSKDSKTTYVFKAGDGNDVITSGKGVETVEFSATDYDKITYTQVKKDLIIGYNLDGENKAQDTVTIKNYFDKKGNVVSPVKNLTCNQGTYDLETLRSIYNGEGNYLINEGKDGNDNIILTTPYNVDIKNGDDTIYIGGLENSNITIGHGKKTIVTPEGFNSNVRLYTGDSLDKKYYKVGNDLVVKHTTEGWENDSVTVKDYFVGDRKVYLYIDYVSSYFNIEGNGVIVEGEGFIEGRSSKMDYINGSDKDDIIYMCGYDRVHPNKGNDTLVFKQYYNKNTGEPYSSASMGQPRIYLKNGDGNNTFIFELKPQDSLWHLYLEGNSTLKYEKKGNDLLIHSTYNDGTKDITETQTIKNWVVSDLANSNIHVYRGEEYVNGLDFLLKRVISENGEIVIQTNSYNDSVDLNLYGSDGNDWLITRGTNTNVYGYGGDDLYHLRGTGITANDTKGNEEYRGYALQNKATIIDSEGNDSLTLYDESSNGHGNLNDDMENRQLHLMFNVTKDYKATQGAAAVGDVIVTTDASKENYDLWQTDGEFKGISIKNNAVETITTSDETPYTITNDAVATLAENVAGWLTTNNYADVSAVFSKPDNAADITALIAQFDNAGWTV